MQIYDVLVKEATFSHFLWILPLFTTIMLLLISGVIAEHIQKYLDNHFQNNPHHIIYRDLPVPCPISTNIQMENVKEEKKLEPVKKIERKKTKKNKSKEVKVVSPKVEDPKTADDVYWRFTVYRRDRDVALFLACVVVFFVLTCILVAVDVRHQLSSNDQQQSGRLGHIQTSSKYISDTINKIRAGMNTYDKTLHEELGNITRSIEKLSLRMDGYYSGFIETQKDNINFRTVMLTTSVFNVFLVILVAGVVIGLFGHKVKDLIQSQGK